MGRDTGAYCISHIGHSRQVILRDILLSYHIEEITLDMTYSVGELYKKTRDKDGKPFVILPPKNKMDIYPRLKGVCVIGKDGRIPLEDSSCKCIIYSPPYKVIPRIRAIVDSDEGQRRREEERHISFSSINELIETYRFHMEEIARLLEREGYAIVECQNVNASKKNINSPEYFWLLGEGTGLNMIDKFVFIPPMRGGAIRYFLLFQKSKSAKIKYLDFGEEKDRESFISTFYQNNVSKRKKKNGDVYL